MKILLLEDNPADAQIIRLSLASEGITEGIVHFLDGEAAWEFLRSEPLEFQLAILDINVPKISGLELLELIRADERLRGMKVVILSSSPRYAVDARAAQADGYVEKPVTLDEFLKIGAQILSC